MSTPYELPMFPLSVVAMPHEPMSLQVFESRYHQLLDDVGPHGKFGTCLIEHGSEVGGGDVRSSIGTLLEIRMMTPLTSGTTLLFVVGLGRIAVQSWLPEESYPRALVVDLTDSGAPREDVLSTAKSSVRAVRNLENEIFVDMATAMCDFDHDPVLAGWQCCAFASMNQRDRQSVLAKNDTNERLALVAEISCERYGDLQRQIAAQGGDDAFNRFESD
ncbi:MAG: LON peptidase substrate-binding domain-containing protein [Acidobacteria bacterium]|nr:LON peptidase substrate-binding domain-containing protein [Acidobacteriota bacterium]